MQTSSKVQSNFGMLEPHRAEPCQKLSRVIHYLIDTYGKETTLDARRLLADVIVGVVIDDILEDELEGRPFEPVEKS